MAKFELPIYGENDEIIKTFTADHIRWGIFKDAMIWQQEMQGKSEVEQLELVNKLIKAVFPKITDDDLANADMFDLFNIFRAIIMGANKIKNG